MDQGRNQLIASTNASNCKDNKLKPSLVLLTLMQEHGLYNDTILYSNPKLIVLLKMNPKYLLLFFIFSVNIFSQSKTYIREYTYNATEADSKITSSIIALNQVKRLLLEEVGVYLQSEMTVTKEENDDTYNELTKQQIQSVTAGITQTIIIEEKWDGKQYYIKASITVDPHEVNKNIARIATDQNKIKELEKVMQKANIALKEIEGLRKELATTKSAVDKLTKQKEYNSVLNDLSAIEWFQKGFNAYTHKNIETAILFWQKAIDINPLLSEAYYNLGIAYNDKGNIEMATQLWEKVIEINPKYSNAYVNLGIMYKNKGDLDGAILLYQKANKIDPLNNLPYSNLANAYKLKGDYERSIQYYLKSIRLDPKSALAYTNLGITYYEKGDINNAILSWKKAIVVDPMYSDAYSNLGWAYKLSGDLNNAIIFIEKAIEINPNSFESITNLGIVQYESGNIDEAIALYQRAIRINPQYSQAYSNCGLAYRIKGFLDLAIMSFQIAIEKDSKNSNAYYNLALAFEAKGNIELAIKAHKSAAILGDVDSQQWLKENGYGW